MSVEGGQVKLVIFAKRAIAAGEEIKYDYKFPLEEGNAIQCNCEFRNLRGRNARSGMRWCSSSSSEGFNSTLMVVPNQQAERQAVLAE